MASKKFRVEVYDLNDLLDSLGQLKGQWMSICFTSRLTGEQRVVVGRTGVRKHLAGGEPAYDFRDKELFPIWVTEATRREGGKDNGFRAIPKEGITQITARGKRFVVAEGMAYRLQT